MRYNFFRTDILNKTGILVTIVSSLWTRCSSKKIYMRTFALMWPSPPPVRICSHFDSANVIIEWPPISVKFCRYVLQLIRIWKFERAEIESDFWWRQHFFTLSMILHDPWTKWVMLCTAGKIILCWLRITGKTYLRKVLNSSYECLNIKKWRH